MNGVKFGNYHSYSDLFLILAPFTPTPAKPKTNFLQVPGRDGDLDLTEAYGEVKYNSREFTFTFTIRPGDSLTFDERVNRVSEALNGLKCKITLDRDPSYYWVGRCYVDKYAQDKAVGQIVVKAIVDPFKLNHESRVFKVNVTTTINSAYIYHNGRKSVVPTISCNYGGHYVTFFGTGGTGITYTLSAGTQKIPGICFETGTNRVDIKGSCADTITFTWTEGEL